MGVLNGLFSQVANKTVANTTVETSLLNLINKSNEFDPEEIYLGKSMFIKLYGFASRAVGQLQISVKLNNTVIYTTGSILPGALNNDAFVIESALTFRANGLIAGQGLFTNLNNGNVLQMVQLAPVFVNYNIKQVYDITAKWSGLNIGNLITSTNVVANFSVA